jgi:MFS family permease
MKVQSPVNFSWKKAWKEFAPAFVVVVNTLVWYIISYVILTSIIGESAPELQGLFFSVYYIAIALSAIIGAYILPRVERLGLALWMLFGALVSSSMIFIQSSNELVTLIILVLLGVSVGSGLPSALAYFANRTAIEKRGLLGGIIWSAIGFIILLLLVVVGIFGVTLGLLTLVAWRLSGFVLFLLLDRKQVISSGHATPSYRNILRRDVLLYLLPWLMFSIVNFIETPLLDNIMGQELTTTLGLIEFVILGIFAIIGGFMADAFGRKRVVITGFVLLGINYALLSVFSGNPISWYVYTFLDGVTWGMFAVVFFMAVWGDLAMDSRKEKYYVLGGLPYLLSGLLPILAQPYILLVQPSMAFSLASFFLFIAVLPLIYAPETLPEKHVKERDLKNYIEKAKKMVEKNKRTSENQDSAESKSDDQTENNEEYDKAKKLAEQYY